MEVAEVIEVAEAAEANEAVLVSKALKITSISITPISVPRSSVRTHATHAIGELKKKVVAHLGDGDI